MIAERIKENDNISSKKAKFYIEILIPSVAISTLFGVTVYFTWQAILVLRDTSRGEDRVNVAYLYTFAIINLVVDGICLSMFCLRGPEVFIERQSNILPQLSLDTSIHSNNSDEFGAMEDNDFGNDSPRDVMTNKNNSSSLSVMDGIKGVVSHGKKNLNMMSAFIHVGGDSLRTLSVLGAALVSTISGARVDLCDAWGAIVVSSMIFCVIVPLVIDIFRAFCRILREHDEQEYTPVFNDEQDEVIV
jgi:Co/Zn/Cd efflux system component